MVEHYLTYTYGISQLLIFFVYAPHLLTVIRSERADAISVPAQLSFFTIGAISALYMIVVNKDPLATTVICGHIIIGNLSTALIAFYKQRKANLVMDTQFFICSSTDARNNGLLPRCDTRIELRSGYAYNCPTCSAPLIAEAAREKTERAKR
tara:strand:+ start:1840 stop:2295 length:456 start_codon:yes stop_codon:yes gene_type:complete